MFASAAYPNSQLDNQNFRARFLEAKAQLKKLSQETEEAEEYSELLVAMGAIIKQLNFLENDVVDTTMSNEEINRLLAQFEKVQAEMEGKMGSKPAYTHKESVDDQAIIEDERSPEEICNFYSLKFLHSLRGLLITFNENLSIKFNSQEQKFFKVRLDAVEEKIQALQKYLPSPEKFLSEHSKLTTELFAILSEILANAEKCYGLQPRMATVVFENFQMYTRTGLQYIEKIKEDAQHLENFDEIRSEWFIQFNLYLTEVVEKFLYQEEAVTNETTGQVSKNSSTLFSSSPSSYRSSINILLMGDQGVGKSNIKNVFSCDGFSTQIKATIGFDFKFLNQPLPHYEELQQLRIWDGGGCLKNTATLQLIRRNEYDAVFFVCDMARPETMKNLLNWLAMYERYGRHDEAVKILVGNKMDLLEESESAADMQSQLEVLAERYGCVVSLVSAKTSEGISDLFNTAIKLVSVHDRELKDKEVTVTSNNNSDSKRCLLM